MSAIVTSAPFLRHGEDTHGEYSVIEQYKPGGAGPPPHVHPFEDGASYVMAGEMTVIIVGGQTIVLGPGSLGHVPRNTVHEFKITSKEVCRRLNYYTPADFERAVLRCSRPAETRTLPPRGLDTPDSSRVVRFFNHYWVALAELPWSQ